jgi:hypothetical protein
MRKKQPVETKGFFLYSTAGRSRASAEFNTPNVFTGRAPSHPLERMRRVEAALTARGGILAPTSVGAALDGVDAVLAEPFFGKPPRSLASPAEASEEQVWMAALG